MGNITFGEKLKELRNEKDVSLEKMSNETKISKSALSRYELNYCEPRLSEIKILSKYFDLDYEELIDPKE